MVASISATELKQKLQVSPSGNGLLLLDVREADEFEYCRIQGSLNIPLSQITRRIGELNSDREIVVICHHGMRSQQAAMFLEQNDFSSVFNLAGGVEAWANEIEPEMPRY